jgi:beta-glucanase (GH16 family)
MLHQPRSLASSGVSRQCVCIGGFLAGLLLLLVGFGGAAAHGRALTSRASSRKQAVTPQPMGVPGRWQLVLNSNFDGTSLNNRIWRPGWFGQGNQHVGQITGPINTSELACYNPGNITFPGDGAMNLSVTQVASSCGGVARPYSGAVVSTNPHDGRTSGGFQYTYGVLQAKIYVPASRGRIANWPAFMTLGQNWPVTGENDLLEGVAGRVCSRFHSLVSPLVGLGGCDHGFTPGWHIVTANWAPGSVTWYYDGVPVYHETDGVTSAPMYIVLVNTVSEKWAELAMPTTVKVAYVRVWQPAGPRASHPEYRYSF